MAIPQMALDFLKRTYRHYMLENIDAYVARNINELTAWEMANRFYKATRDGSNTLRINVGGQTYTLSDASPQWFTRLTRDAAIERGAAPDAPALLDRLRREGIPSSRLAEHDAEVRAWEALSPEVRARLTPEAWFDASIDVQMQQVRDVMAMLNKEQETVPVVQPPISEKEGGAEATPMWVWGVGGVALVGGLILVMKARK